MSLHITNFAHLVNSTKEQNKPEVTMSVSQANLLLTDIIDLQSKLIGTQEQLIKHWSRTTHPLQGPWTQVLSSHNSSTLLPYLINNIT